MERARPDELESRERAGELELRAYLGYLALLCVFLGIYAAVSQ